VSESSPLLAVDAVGKVYRGNREALRDFNLAVHADEPRIVALAGQSGSGKSTAAQLALGLIAPTSGSIRFRGSDLVRIRRARRTQFRREVQAVLQDPFAAFNPFYRVRHVFEVVSRNFGIGKGERDGARQRIEEAIEFVGLEPGRVLAAFPHELSGGERQRLMIARAWLLRPSLIVADEPVSMVDASIRSAILEVILTLRRKSGVSFLYITHDLSTAYHIADELIVLLDGETVERGEARAVIDRPQHPYTRRLIESVPVPDPDVRWGGGKTV
jgi:peptide/nickel transport system ATP-binding protein